jgi:hypothetical protein
MRKKILKLFGNVLKDNEKRIIEQDWNCKLDMLLKEQRRKFDFVLLDKDNEIKILNDMLDKNRKRMSEALKKEESSMSMIATACELLARAKLSYTQHVENEALLMNELHNIESCITDFAHKLLEVKK